MNLTIVIPYFNGEATIFNLLNSIPKEYPVILVNDKSDSLPDFSRYGSSPLRSFRVLNLNKKGYFTGAVNAGIGACSTDVLILNQDVRFTSPEAFNLLEHYRSKYATIGEAIAGTHPAWPMGYIHGTFMFMRRDAIDKVGLMDAVNYPLWGSTCEWQLRACRKGFKALPVRPIPGMEHSREGNYGSSIQTILKREPDHRGWLIRTPPMISVIVPSYNHAKYIPDLIASLIGGKTSLGTMPGQTLQSFEIIIADDCSTDNTEELMKSLADPWKAIKYVKTRKNGGTSVACNTAIRNANAPIIARIDSDDMREPESLQRLLEALTANPHSFVYDHVVMFGTNGRHPKVWTMPKFNLAETMNKNQVHAGIMFKKEAWAEVGGYPEEMVHGRDDWAFNIALGLKGWCGVLVDYPGYLYRREGQNRTLRNTTPAWRSSFLKQLRGLFPEAYSGGKEMPCCGQGRTTYTGSGAGSRRSGDAPLNEPIIPGSMGMTVVEYQRGNYGMETYYGPFTGTAYTFSAHKKRGYVDNRDLHFTTGGGKSIGILDIRENGKALFTVFKVAKPVAPAEPVTPVEPEIEKLEEEEEFTEEEFAEEELDESSEAAVDDFTQIKGVGKAIAKKLTEAGFSVFEDLAEFDPDILATTLDVTYQKAVSIVEQAREKVGWKES